MHAGLNSIFMYCRINLTYDCSLFHNFFMPDKYQERNANVSYIFIILHRILESMSTPVALLTPTRHLFGNLRL